MRSVNRSHQEKKSQTGRSNLVKDSGTATSAAVEVEIFSTPLGWVGLVGSDGELVTVTIGNRTASAAKTRVLETYKKPVFADWNTGLREMLEAYAHGDVIDFRHVRLRLPEMTTFRQNIIAATRNVAYGQTATYGELAARIGHPNAYRAAGTAMSTNRFPIVIPCHRILAAGGKLGGYTAPSGLGLKVQLLELEARGAGRFGDCRWSKD